MRRMKLLSSRSKPFREPKYSQGEFDVNFERTNFVAQAELLYIANHQEAILPWITCYRRINV